MKMTKKTLATATVAATALAGLSVAVAPGASAATTATKSFSKSFNQTCTVGPFGSHILGATVSGTTPTTVKRGAAFSLTNGKIKVVVGVAADGAPNLNAQAFSVGARFQKVTFKTVNLNNTDIAPATKNALTKSITTGFVPVPNGGTSNFLAPTSGALTVALKGGTKAGTGTIKAGSVSATFTLYDAAKNPILQNQPVTCGATNTALTTLKVS